MARCARTYRQSGTFPASPIGSPRPLTSRIAEQKRELRERSACQDDQRRKSAHNRVLAENVVFTGQEARWYSWMTPVGAENAVTLRDLGIFVDQATEPVSAQDPDILAHSEWTLTPAGGLWRSVRCGR